MEQHIGLGREAHVISIDVFWPATKSRQQFTNVAKNQYIEIREFAQDFITLKRQPIQFGRNDLTGRALQQIGRPRKLEMSKAGLLTICFCVWASVCAAGPKQYPARGIVIEIDRNALSVVISCEPIPDHMDAMEMSFRVHDSAVLNGLNAGATVHFTMVEDGSTSFCGANKGREKRQRRGRANGGGALGVSAPRA